MKKGITIRILAFLLLIGGFSFLHAAPVRAAYVTPPSNVKQVGAAKDSITMTWSPAKNAVEYRVYYREYLGKEYTFSGNTTGTSYTVAGLSDGTKYSIQVKAFDGTNESGGGTVYEAVTLPDQITGFKQKRWYYFANILDVEWDKKSGVTGYEVLLSNHKGKVIQKDTLNAYTTFKAFHQTKNCVYIAKVRAYTIYNNNKYYTPYKSINCIPQARVSKFKKNGNKLTLNWNQVDGATGYQIYVSTKPKKGYKLVKTVGKKSKSCTITKIKGKKINPKKTYYVYVKTICKKGGKKGTSGALYYWSTKNSSFNYLTK